MCIIRPYTWYGGKIRFLIPLWFLIPRHSVWVEPFMGSAALTLNHPRSMHEVVCDIDSDLICFMRTLADSGKYKNLMEQLGRLEYSEETFLTAKQHKANGYAGLDDVGRSVMVYVTISQSFNSVRKSFSRGKSTQQYKEDILFYLPKVHERLQGVEILNGDALDIIHDYKHNADAFLFLDPPYRKDLRGKSAGKVYTVEMPDVEQIRFLETVKDASCKAMLCGYRSDTNDLYDKYLLSHGWKCYKVMDIVKACQTKEHKDMGHEFIWVNYQLPELAKYVISMEEYSSL